MTPNYYRNVANTPRVAITGIGVVSAFGVGRQKFWDSVSHGRSGVRAMHELDLAHSACRVAAPVPDAGLGEDDETRRAAKVSKIAVIAAREALADAGIEPAHVDDLGVIVGSGAGGIDVAERHYGDFYAGDYHRVSPYVIPVSIVGIVSSEISIALGLRGISHVLSNGCTSSTDAIGYAASMIRHGDAEVLVTGGADACVTPGTLFGFSRMRAVATKFNERPAEASRPFDRAREGFVLGEGAWLMTVESEARAKARGAKVYAYIDGYASTCDAYHRVQMDPEGTEIVRAMTMAIERSGRMPRDIGYVNYHGTSTQLNDAVEAQCVARLFGDDAGNICGSSTKSMIGHPQGASGAAGIVATALGMSHDLLPPTINLTDPDPACAGLDFIPNVARERRVDAALCNCLGFGSKNSAIVLGRG